MKNSIIKFPPSPRGSSASELMERLGVDAGTSDRLAATLPFSAGDCTCGSENELQAAVIGGRDRVDLPVTIEDSNYFANILRRRRRGELTSRAVGGLEKWLDGNDNRVWENSWVRLPRRRLGNLASRVLKLDLAADKNDPASGLRGDTDRFLFTENGEDYLRAPVSYLLKLALVDAAEASGDESTRAIGLRCARHFLSDNTSPETFSFHVVDSSGGGLGRAAAAEMSRRFLLTQLLVQYAGRKFGLLESGQQVTVYSAPHPPVRQKELSDCITDSFYRELFMNPCLSGWDRGEDKLRYMHLCHEVLSRAQLNSLGRLREAGIITSNLVVLPSASNISLANNGIHVSLGSRRLTRALAGPSPSIDAGREKYFGDLVIKLVEHFLPLFVGTYSAAPYRLDFKDFHPEKVLCFLPYELDYTHLRMIWRRWRKKAALKAKYFGFRLTPFGPPLLDKALARAFGLRGDLVPDYRLIDYLAAVMGTASSPALDGSPDSQPRLKRDLTELGVYDSRMAVYMLYRQRIFSQMGFSGFEGRFYSLFPSLAEDLVPAVNLQNLVTALAFQLIATGRLTHAHVPDDPETESERRQIFFGTAIGLPTFYVRKNTGNLFLKTILEDTAGVRDSRRYPGYLRVKHKEYRRALVRYLTREAPALVEALEAKETLEDLRWRLEYPERNSAAGKLVQNVVGELASDDPLDASSTDFNRAAENYYRHNLRANQLREAWEIIEEDLAHRPLAACTADGGRPPLETAEGLKPKVLAETASSDELTTAIRLVLTTVARHCGADVTTPPEYPFTGENQYGFDDSPVHRQANR